jgi:myo-inositol-1-phosphate synthase
MRTTRTKISPSMIYAVASILEGCAFLNGSPQNTIGDGVSLTWPEINKTYCGRERLQDGADEIQVHHHGFPEHLRNPG